MVSWGVLGAVLRRPDLWVQAVRTAVAMAPDGWWRRPPFLPIPDRSYTRWRVATAYGDPESSIAGEDVVAYLEWCKRQRSQG